MKNEFFTLPLIPSHADITLQNWIIAGGENDGFIPPFLPIWNFSEVLFFHENQTLSFHMVEFAKV